MFIYYLLHNLTMTEEKKQFPLMLTDKERKTLDKRAVFWGRSTSNYIRWCLFNRLEEDGKDDGKTKV